MVLLAAALLLPGFSIWSIGYVSTSRVRWDVDYVGAAYNTVVPETTNLRHCFQPGGVSQVFGYDQNRVYAGVCSYGIAGTDDGGTNSITVEIVHEDGGVDCTCTGAAECDSTPNVPFTCICNGGSGAVLGRTVMPDAGEQFPATYCVQVSSATDCWTNPAQFSCSFDLVR
jgi:hypothetical protein